MIWAATALVLGLWTVALTLVLVVKIDEMKRKIDRVLDNTKTSRPAVRKIDL